MGALASVESGLGGGPVFPAGAIVTLPTLRDNGIGFVRMPDCLDMRISGVQQERRGRHMYQSALYGVRILLEPESVAGVPPTLRHVPARRPAGPLAVSRRAGHVDKSTQLSGMTPDDGADQGRTMPTGKRDHLLGARASVG